MSIDFEQPPATATGLEIVEVRQDPGARLQGHFRALGNGRRLEIVGWVLGLGAAVADLVVVADGVEAARTPVAVPRPDVAEKYPREPAAATCGFRVELQGEGEGLSRLELFALLEDESRQPLGSILCRSRS